MNRMPGHKLKDGRVTDARRWNEATATAEVQLEEFNPEHVMLSIRTDIGEGLWKHRAGWSHRHLRRSDVELLHRFLTSYLARQGETT